MKKAWQDDYLKSQQRKQKKKGDRSWNKYFYSVTNKDI